MLYVLTLKAPRKTASENVVCLCRLLNILANFSNLFFAYRQTVWTQIRLLLKEQSDLGPHCLQKWLLKSQAEDKADDNLLWLALYVLKLILFATFLTVIWTYHLWNDRLRAFNQRTHKMRKVQHSHRKSWRCHFICNVLNLQRFLEVFLHLRFKMIKL